MVLHKDSGLIEHKRFYELPAFLKAGDTLVINNTKVTPARLIGKDKKTREVLLVNELNPAIWEVLIKPHRGLRPNEEIVFEGGNLSARINSKTREGTYIIEFSTDKGIFNKGYMPLPPYIKRNYTDQSSLHQMDRMRYQTVYAKHPGAIAAPTAGMHFTEDLLGKIRLKEVNISPITLHVGWGTFKPVRADNITDHKMLPEQFCIPKSTAEKIEKAKRVIAVGTTTVRCLETGTVSGYTNLFIYPPYKFKVVNALITNFHLPKSTLLMLASAFAGRDFIMEAYAEAIKHRYRFYSYGDAMLIL